MNKKTNFKNTAATMLKDALGAETNQFLPILDGIAAGEHMMVSGLPSSGKTTLAAILMNCLDGTVVLSGSGEQAKNISQRAFALRQNDTVRGESRSFASAVLEFFNKMRDKAQLKRIRLVSDAEVLGWMDSWVTDEVPDDLQAAVQTADFRKNILDGIFRVRCEEQTRELKTVNPWVKELLEKLRQKAKNNEELSGKRPWELDTGSLYEEYLRALDTADVIEQPELVVLDDWQNANGLMQEIAAKWAATGTQIVALGLPDLSCNEYRGGTPHALPQLANRLRQDTQGRPLRAAYLVNMYASKQLQDFWHTTINTFGATVSGARVWEPNEEASNEEAPQSDDNNTAGIHLLEAPTDTRQYRLIAEFFQEAHIFSPKPVPYSQMAVLVNSNKVGQEVEKQLKNLGIPVSRPGASSQVNEGRFSGWLLKLLKIVCAKELEFADFSITDFLRSELFGWSPTDLCALDDILLSMAFPEPVKEDFSDVQSYEDALAENEIKTRRFGNLPWVTEYWEALLSGDYFYGKPVDKNCDNQKIQDLLKLRDILGKTQELWLKDKGSAQMLLWSLWDGLGRAEQLRNQTFSPRLDTSVRDQLNLELDLVMDLFKAADWYEQRYPEGDTADFATKMLERTLPTGTVAPHHQSVDAVTIITPTGAVSKHWKIVALAGLNDGSWPNNSWPGDLLGTSMFDLTQQESGESERGEAGFQWSFRSDFRRFFAAITRASETLVLGVSKNDLLTPSVFVSRLMKHPKISELMKSIVYSSGCASGIVDKPPANLRGMISFLRSITMFSEEAAQRLHLENSQKEEAAQLLALLGKSEYAEGVFANPDSWLGILRPTSPSSNAEANETISSETQKVVRIRASGLESLLQNPFDTEMSRLGYQDEQDMIYNPGIIGTLVHKVAEEMGKRHWQGDSADTKVDFLDYAAVYEESKEILNQFLEDNREQNWVFVNFENRLNHLVERLSEFLYTYQYPSLFECGYRMRIPASNQPGAIEYTAVIDRILFTPQGIMLVDYKTGSAVNFTEKLMNNNLQLLLYQKAFNEGKPIKNAPQGLSAAAAWIVALRGNPIKSSVTGMETYVEDLAQKARKRILGNKEKYDVPEKPTLIRIQNSLANFTEPVEIANPMTAEHRLLLIDPQQWLEIRNSNQTDFGLGDRESMTLQEFLQDRVNLAVSALKGEKLVQRQEIGGYFKQEVLPVEVEN